MKKLILLFTLLTLSTSALSKYNYSLSKNIDKSMRQRVNFWKRVYTEISSYQAFIHDRDNVDIVYTKVNLSKSSQKARFRSAKKEVKKIQKILRSIVKKKAKRLNSTERKIYKSLRNKNLTQIKRMIKRVRAQYGLRDNYYIGLKKSYLYLDYIRSQMKRFGVPRELAYLPHVESSFNYQAYSKVGAAGIWQFMRGTAKNYRLKINYTIDERRDVFKATRAAVKLLKYNYSRIKSWPLAITAYNHGLASMQRAVKKTGSKKISTIIKNYKGRRFGFASKNFYATFLATVEISNNPEKYFKKFKRQKALSYSTVKLPKELSIGQVISQLALSKKIVKQYNPAIRSTAYSYGLPLPKSFELRIPKRNKKDLKNMASLLKNTKRFKNKASKLTSYKVRRGDNLYTISKKLRVSLPDLIRMNGLENPSKIFVGMKLKIKAIETVAQKNKPQLKPALKTLKPAKDVARLLQEDPEKDEEKLDEASKKVNLENLDLDLKKLATNTYSLKVETGETLGHFADWGKQKTQRIRNTNGFKRGKYISLGQTIKIKLSPKQKESFATLRAEYHMAIQEDFYQNFKIENYSTYKVKSGDSFNKIATDFKIPLWLLRVTQPKLFSYKKALYVGKTIRIPKVASLEMETK